MSSHQPLSARTVAALLGDLRANESVRVLAGRYRVSRQAIYYHANKAGIPLPKRGAGRDIRLSLPDGAADRIAAAARARQIRPGDLLRNLACIIAADLTLLDNLMDDNARTLRDAA